MVQSGSTLPCTGFMAGLDTIRTMTVHTLLIVSSGRQERQEATTEDQGVARSGPPPAWYRWDSRDEREVASDQAVMHFQPRFDAVEEIACS
jgi:hypothetical protein